MKKVIVGMVVCVLCILLMVACGKHEHQWIAASCVEPSLCKTCGETKGERLGHVWENATCATPKTCSMCEKTEGAPNPHTWAEATCLEAKGCINCDAVEGEALGHDVAEWKTVTEASCKADGIANGKCLRCQETVEKPLNKIEHQAGEWEITVKATIDKNGTREKKCTLCQEVLESEEYEISEQERKKLYKAACQKYKYSEIARSPDKFKGKQAKFTGEVVQVQQKTLGDLIFYVLRVNVTKKGSYYKYYTDTVYVTYTASKDDPRILEDDIITMYGTLEGEKTYTTVLGASMTIPEFSAKYIDIK